MSETVTTEEQTVSTSKGKVLVIDDEADIRESLDALLSLEGYEVELAANGTEGSKKLDSHIYDLVLLDLMMPDRSGMEVLRGFRERDRETPIFMITAFGSTETAVNALKLGANDYFTKPWENDKLLIEIDRTITQRRLLYENTNLKRAFKQRYSFPNIIGKSERMVRVLDLVGQVASSRSTILITGETGTGKELVAKAIHAHSPRAEFMFVPVNSGSLPPDLLESTLFGHVKGAFTSADRTRKGYFEVANHGTIFFDEIGTIGPETQAKLLRVIQEKEFDPLGSNDIVEVDVRILAALMTTCASWSDEEVSPGPVLPAQRHQHRATGVARTERGHSAAGGVFLHEVLPGKSEVPGFPKPFCAAFPAGRYAGSDGLQLAGQRARAGERSGARRGAGFGTSVPADVLPDSILQAAGVRIRRILGDFPPTLPSLKRWPISSAASSPRFSKRSTGARQPPRTPSRTALHPQSEDQATGHRDSAEV